MDTTTNAPALTNLPKPLMMCVAFVQGFCLFLLYQSLKNNYWPGTSTVFLFIGVAVSIVVPTFFLLVIDNNNLRKALHCLAPFSLITIGVAAWSGWQLTPQEFVRNEMIILPFILTIGIASFKALMYAQEYAAGKTLSYSSLFQHSWRNFLTVALSLLFMGLFFGILLLWGALFDVIGINFFQELFEEEWFFFPAGSMAFTFAIIIFRSLSNIIDSIAALKKALIKFLLPLLSGLSVIFLLALLVQGFAPLWQTNMGSGLVLWLQAVLLFSVNAVYQGDDQSRPYPIFIHRLIYIGIAILPVYSLAALYGILTRIDQYGLTVMRCWALLVSVILFLFALGYLWGIIKQRDNWLSSLAWVNIRMGLTLMALMVLVNTPVASFQKYSTFSQLNRLRADINDNKSYSLDYFRYSLGRQGYLAIETLKEEYADNPSLMTAIERLYQPYQPNNTLVRTTQELAEVIQVWPQGRQIPEAVLQGLLEQYPAPIATPMPNQSYMRDIAFNVDDEYHALFVELNNDNRINNTEEIVLIRNNNAQFQTFQLWEFKQGQWQSLMLSTNYNEQFNINTILEQNQIEVIPALYNDLQLGDKVIRVPLDFRTSLSR